MLYRDGSRQTFIYILFFRLVYFSIFGVTSGAPSLGSIHDSLVVDVVVIDWIICTIRRLVVTGKLRQLDGLVDFVPFLCTSGCSHGGYVGLVVDDISSIFCNLIVAMQGKNIWLRGVLDDIRSSLAA